MEEFFLGSFFILQELDIIDDETVDGTVFFLKIFDRMVLNSVNDFVGESLAGNIFDFRVGTGIQDSVAMACIRWVFPKPELP